MKEISFNFCKPVDAFALLNVYLDKWQRDNWWKVGIVRVVQADSGRVDAALLVVLIHVIIAQPNHFK